MSVRSLSQAFVALFACAAAGATVDGFAAARQAAGWVSYVVPLAGRDAPCCFSWRGGTPLRKGCRLDRRGSEGFGTISGSGVQPSARGVELQIYLRFERGELRQLLAVGSDCPVDAGAHAVRALEGVSPAASAALLLEAAERGHDGLAEEALQALAMHDGVGTDALLALARDARRAPAARRQALFWLAQSEDPRALAEIEAILSR